jgi:hypothetical protein
MDRDDVPTDAELSLEDLAQIVCEGNIEGELQQRVARVIRSDPRFAHKFAVLEEMTAEAGAEDLWEGLDRHLELDRLLEDGSWEDPAEVLEPAGNDHYQVSYRGLLAVADARIAKADDPAPIQAVKDRLLRAQRQPLQNAVFQVAEALEKLSPGAAEEVIAEVRRKWLRQPAAGD